LDDVFSIKVSEDEFYFWPTPRFFLFFFSFEYNFLFGFFGKNDHHTTRFYSINSQIGLPLRLTSKEKIDLDLKGKYWPWPRRKILTLTSKKKLTLTSKENIDLDLEGKYWPWPQRKILTLTSKENFDLDLKKSFLRTDRRTFF